MIYYGGRTELVFDHKTCFFSFINSYPHSMSSKRWQFERFNHVSSAISLKLEFL